jgi:hypothetical protein
MDLRLKIATQSAANILLDDQHNANIAEFGGIGAQVHG